MTGIIRFGRNALGWRRTSTVDVPASGSPTPPPAPTLLAPSNSALPIITGATTKGQTLSCSTGSWLNLPTGFSYQWLRSGTAISGANGATYLLIAADVAANISCTVTASNTTGSTPATSATVGPVIDLAPVNTVLPALTGTPTVGQLLSVTNGTWINTPTSYSYAWKNGGASIAGATNASTYTLTSTENGGNITCVVTATNSGGGVSATSNILGPVGTVSSPTLSSPTAATTGSQTASLSVTTDTGNGTLYWTVDTTITTPTVAQIVAGQNASGAAATATGSQSVTTTGVQNGAAVGLSPSTVYYAHFVQKNASLVASNTISSTSFTTSAFATPTLSIQSATGAAPLVLQWSDTDYVAGLYGQLQIDQTSSAFANITQNIVFIIDASNVTTLNESIGLATPAGQYWARIRTARDNDTGSTTVTGNEWNGQAFNAVSFPADVSAWSNTVNDTITASIAAWTGTTGTKKNSGVTVTGSPALVMQGGLGTGASQDVAATIAGAGKSQWEITLTTLATDGNHFIDFGRYNTTTDLSTTNIRPGISDANGYCIQVAPGLTSLDIFFNNAANLITTVTLGTAVALGDVFTDELDISGAAGTHVLKVYRNGTLVATASGKTLTGFSTAWAGVQSNEKLTANYGGTAFTHTLNAGFVIYG